MSTPPLPFFLSQSDAPAKQEILKAALRLFVRDGLSETTIRGIAAESGYTNPALFKHFESKEAVATYLFERSYRRYASELHACISADRPFGDNLGAVIGRFLELFEEQPEAFLFMNENLRRFWPHVTRPLKALSLVRLTRTLLAQGVKEGVVAQDADLDVLVAGVIGTLGQFARMAYFGEFGGEVTRRRADLEKVVRNLLRS